MPKLIVEFETMFRKLERMGENTKVLESHKAPLLLANLRINSQLEDIIAALRLGKFDSLTCKSVRSDLLQE